MTHYIAMAGLHGYLPYCEVYLDYGSACEGLATIHELTHAQAQELAEDGYLELDLHKHGNEYCEVESCECPEPWVHSEFGTPEDWEE